MERKLILPNILCMIGSDFDLQLIWLRIIFSLLTSSELMKFEYIIEHSIKNLKSI
jgi:hypothetical protein